MMEEARQLQDLRRINAERWDTVKELHREWNQQKMNDATQELEAAPVASSSSLRETALRAELELLLASSSTDEARRRRHHHPTLACYSKELVDSYDELQQTNTVLTSQYAALQKRLEDMKQLVQQHERIHETLLLSSQPQSNQKESSSSPAPSHETLLQQEHEWLKSELEYVAQVWEEQQQLQKRSPEDDDDTKMPAVPRPKRKRRRKQHAETSSSSRDNGGFWSLDRLVLELTQRFLASPTVMDPNYYLFVDQHHLSSIDPRHLEVLRKCQIVEQHEDNPNLIRLVDYTR